MSRPLLARRLALLGAAGLAVPAVAQTRATAPARPPLIVGPGRAFPTIAAAVAAAQDGDTLQVRAGTYANDFVVIGRRIAIRAVGGLAQLVASVPPPNGKALLVIRADCVVEGLEFSGVANPNLNGAGIRYEGGHLEILRCRFHGNQMNMLAAPAPDGSITIVQSEFGLTVPHASLSHSLYANGVGILTVRDSLFHGAASGHQIKSRALRTVVINTRIFEGGGNGAYNVDIPNGGDALLLGNVLEQGPNTRNPAIVHFGGEENWHPVSALRLIGNTVVNHLPLHEARFLRNLSETMGVVSDTRVFGISADQMATGPAQVTGTQILAAAPALDMTPPWRR